MDENSLQNQPQKMMQGSFKYDPNELWDAVCKGNIEKLNENITMMGEDKFNANMKIGKGPNKDNTLLHWAAYHNQPEIVKILAKYGADFTAKNSAQKTPLQIAEEEKHTGEIIEILKKNDEKCIIC